MTFHHSHQLKIKLISLALEAKAIRRIERRLFNFARSSRTDEATRTAARADAHSLQDHRRGPVSGVARDTLLAYGFLKGLPYKLIENRRYSDPSWKSIEDMARRYGGAAFDKDIFAKWKDAAGGIDSRYPRNKVDKAA